MSGKLKITRDSQIDPIYQAMRKGSLRIDIEQVHGVEEAGDPKPIQIPAWISMEKDQLYLNLRGIPKQADFEEAISLFARLKGKTVTIKSSDFIQVQAQTEKGIPVVLEGVTPVIGRGNSHYSHAGGSRSHERISFQRISFPAAGMDALNSEEHSKLLHEVCGTEPEADEAATNRIPKDEFYAILPDVEQRVFNGGTKTVTEHPFFGELSASHTDCLTGELHGGEFCLEKHDAGMLVHLHCPVGDSTPDEACAKFTGLLKAIAFLHGCNPWPNYFCHHRDNKVIERWLQPRSDLQSNPMPPLRSSDLNLRGSGKGEALFLVAATFFAEPSENATRFNKALWLMRESCREGTPKEISVLTLCSVFDGLIKPLRGKKPCGKLKGEKLKQFRWVVPIESKLGLSFADVEKAVGYWDIYRNPLAHGFEEPKPQDKAEILDAYAHLFGAIYMVMARQMGFKETMPQTLFGS